MFESIELTFFRKVVLLVACVLLPGFVYGVLLLLGQDRPEPNVRYEVARVVGLENVQRLPFSGFGDAPAEFEQCVSERGRELCLRLLGEQVSRGFSGQLGAVDDAAKGAGNSDKGGPQFIGQARFLVAGFVGIAVALCCTMVGVRISAG